MSEVRKTYLANNKDELERLRERNRAMKGKPRTDLSAEALQRITEAARINSTGRKHTEESRRKISLWHKRRWAQMSPEQRSKRALPWCLAGKRAQVSPLEQAIGQVLMALGESFEAQKPISHPMGYFVVDFYLPARNLVIECDGRYWHNLPGRQETDRRRDAELRKMGYSVLRLSEEVIRKDPEQALLSGLKAI